MGQHRAMSLAHREQCHPPCTLHVLPQGAGLGPQKVMWRQGTIWWCLGTAHASWHARCPPTRSHTHSHSGAPARLWMHTCVHPATRTLVCMFTCVH